jgi:hypothetical protein
MLRYTCISCLVAFRCKSCKLTSAKSEERTYCVIVWQAYCINNKHSLVSMLRIRGVFFSRVLYLPTQRNFIFGVRALQMKLVYSVVVPVPRIQVLAPIFNYILTNSEDRRFEAAVSDTEPVVCLSVCLYASRLLALSRCCCGCVRLRWCTNIARTCSSAARNGIRMNRPYRWTDRQTDRQTDSRSANNFTCCIAIPSRMRGSLFSLQDAKGCGGRGGGVVVSECSAVLESFVLRGFASSWLLSYLQF